MSCSRRILEVTAALLLGGGVGSTAQAAWTEPQPVAETSGRYPLFAAFGAGGASSIGVFGPLTRYPGTPQVPVAVARSAASSVSGFGPAKPTPGGVGAPVAVSPGGAIISVGGPRGPFDDVGRESRSARLLVRIGRVGGALRPVATNGVTATRTLAAAINDRGDAAVAFSRCLSRACAHRSTYVTYRPRGGTFGAPALLARRTGFPVASIAMNAGGDALVAWSQHRASGRGNDVRARVRYPGGESSRVRVLGPTEPVPTIVTALSEGRHGVVGWFSQAVSEGSGGGPYTVSSVDLNSAGEAGGRDVEAGDPPGHVRQSDAIPGVRMRALLAPDGAATFAWTGFSSDGHHVVQVQRISRDVADAETLLSPPGIDAQLMDLASDSSGDAIIVWATLPAPDRPPTLAAAIRPAGASAFGPSQTITTGAGASGSAAAAISSEAAIVAAGPSPVIDGPRTPVVVTRLPR